MSCACPDPTLCQRLRRHIAGRDWEIWIGEYKGAPVSPEDRASLIAQWEQIALRLPPLDTPRTLGEKVVTMTHAYAKWAADGFRVCTPEQVATRRALCDACPHMKNDHCTQCGCKLGVGGTLLKGKLELPLEQCPIGKWGIL